LKPWATILYFQIPGLKPWATILYSHIPRLKPWATISVVPLALLPEAIECRFSSTHISAGGTTDIVAPDFNPVEIQDL